MKHFLFVLLFLSSFACNSQNISQLYSNANKSYSKGDFGNAIQYYSEIINRHEKLPHIYLLLGNSYLNNLQYLEALETYLKVIEIAPQKFPESYFRLAELQLMLGNTSEAKMNFNYFLTLPVTDSILYKKTKNIVSNIKNEPAFTDSINLNEDTLTPFIHSYSISKYENKLIYNGILKQGDSLSNQSTFFYSDSENQNEFESIFSNKEISFSDFCETQNPDSILFITRKSLYLYDNPQLNFSKKNQNNWNNPQPITFPYNNTIIIHPYIARVGLHNILFFASDMNHGFGGMDIWQCEILGNGNFSVPINVGKEINTPGDEICPFYDTISKKLYFSSDWHDSMGGFDIFYSFNNNQTWEQPINVGKPINSTFNDYYFRIIDSLAYITSNREKTILDSSNYFFNKLYYFTIYKKPITKPQLIQQSKSLKTISLYFNHNCPKETENLLYSTEYENYIQAKKTYLSNEDSITSAISYMVYKNNIENFFDTCVSKNYQNISELIQQIKISSEYNDTITIELQAYTSAGGNYNFNSKLAQRRVEATKNLILQELKINGILTENIYFEILPAIISNNIQKESDKFTLKEALQRKITIRLKEI